jgi:SNF2 family DNA or RNA helicase
MGKMKTSITIKNDRLRVLSAYNPVFIERFRQIEGRKFDGETKEWTFSASAEALTAICDVCGVLPWMCSSDVQELLKNDPVLVPKTAPADISLVNGHKFLTAPFEHQRNNLARLLASPRWIICDEMGTGKTHAVCNRLVNLFRQNGCGPEPSALILCPKSVVSGWVEELMKHAGLFGEIVGGNAKQRAESLGHTDGIRVANYELLLHSDFSVISWDVVVLDELHRVKNFTAQTSKKVRALTSKASCVWGLSGTPAPNGLEDWLGVLAAVNPDLLPTKTKTAFEARYCVKRELQPGVWKVSGYKNVQELHGFIQSITSRVTKEEVLDLPPKTFVSRRVTLDGEQARVYRELKKDAVAKISKLKDLGELTIRNVLTESLRLLQVVGGHMPTDDGAVHDLDPKAKLPALAEVLDELGERQAVIWCCFRDEVVMLQKWLAEKGYSVSSLVGGMGGNERAENLEAFRERRCQLHVGTSAAGGTGINQLVGADTCIYYSRNFSLTEYLQSQDRLHRIGQNHNVTIVKLLAAGTIDEKIDQILDQKKDVLTMMMQGAEDLLN